MKKILSLFAVLAVSIMVTSCINIMQDFDNVSIFGVKLINSNGDAAVIGNNDVDFISEILETYLYDDITFDESKVASLDITTYRIDLHALLDELSQSNIYNIDITPKFDDSVNEIILTIENRLLESLPEIATLSEIQFTDKYGDVLTSETDPTWDSIYENDDLRVLIEEYFSTSYQIDATQGSVSFSSIEIINFHQLIIDLVDFTFENDSEVYAFSTEYNEIDEVLTVLIGNNNTPDSAYVDYIQFVDTQGNSLTGETNPDFDAVSNDSTISNMLMNYSYSLDYFSGKIDLYDWYGGYSAEVSDLPTMIRTFNDLTFDYDNHTYTFFAEYEAVNSIITVIVTSTPPYTAMVNSISFIYDGYNPIYENTDPSWTPIKDNADISSILDSYIGAGNFSYDSYYGYITFNNTIEVINLPQLILDLENIEILYDGNTYTFGASVDFYFKTININVTSSPIMNTLKSIQFINEYGTILDTYTTPSWNIFSSDYEIDNALYSLSYTDNSYEGNLEISSGYESVETSVLNSVIESINDLSIETLDSIYTFTAVYSEEDESLKVTVKQTKLTRVSKVLLRDTSGNPLQKNGNPDWYYFDGDSNVIETYISDYSDDDDYIYYTYSDFDYSITLYTDYYSSESVYVKDIDVFTDGFADLSAEDGNDTYTFSASYNTSTYNITLTVSTEPTPKTVNEIKFIDTTLNSLTSSSYPTYNDVSGNTDIATALSTCFGVGNYSYDSSYSKVSIYSGISVTKEKVSTLISTLEDISFEDFVYTYSVVVSEDTENNTMTVKFERIDNPQPLKSINFVAVSGTTSSWWDLINGNADFHTLLSEQTTDYYSNSLNYTINASGRTVTHDNYGYRDLKEMNSFMNDIEHLYIAYRAGYYSYKLNFATSYNETTDIITVTVTSSLIS